MNGNNKPLAQVQRRPVRLGAIEVLVANRVVQKYADVWLRKGTSFATLYLSRDASQDLQLPPDQAEHLDHFGRAFASWKGETIELVRA